MTDGRRGWPRRRVCAGASEENRAAGERVVLRGFMMRSGYFWLLALLYGVLVAGLFIADWRVGTVVGLLVALLFLVLTVPSIELRSDVLIARARLKSVRIPRSSIAAVEYDEGVEALTCIALDMAFGPRHVNLAIQEKNGRVHDLGFIAGRPVTIQNLIRTLQHWRKRGRMPTN